MLRADRVDEADPENVTRLKVRSAAKGDGQTNPSTAISRTTRTARRMPLSDKSNFHKNVVGATDYQSFKQDEQSSNMNGTQAREGNSSSAWWTASNEECIRELKNALRETLEENRRVHATMKRLQRENEELQERSRQLDLVSMLYEVAKKELAEYQLREQDQLERGTVSSTTEDDKEDNTV